MVFRLFLLFTLLPALELAILIEVGTVIGTLNTIILVIGTAIIGAWLVSMEGLGVLYRFQTALLEGRIPAEEMLDGAIILAAGALLVTPGLCTDVTGFLLVFPGSRRILKRWLKRYIEKRVSRMEINIDVIKDQKTHLNMDKSA